MQQYRLRWEEYTVLKKKVLVRIMPFMIIIAVILCVTQGYNPRTGEISWLSILGVLAIFTLFCWWSIYRILNRQKKIFETYRLTVHDNLIIREQYNSPKIEIYVSEITSMSKSTVNHIVIRGKSPNEIIYVPPQLENYEELERRLEGFMLIVPSPKKTFFQRYQPFVLLLVLVLFVASLGATNAIVSAACGLPVVGICLYIFFAGQQNKNYDKRAKRSLWSFLLISILVTANIVLKLVYF
jgi:hypothetical protein